MDTVQAIVSNIRQVVGDASEIALHEPNFGKREISLVVDCIQSGWVSSVGKYVDRLEQELADYTDSAAAVAVVNGTAALHMCLQLAGVRSGDEVLAPALTFIATANAIHYAGAVPHFVDIAENTLGICPSALDKYLAEVTELRTGGVPINRRTGRRLAAVVPMHTFGVPVDMDALTEVCEQYHIPIIEDAAESLGSTYKNRHTGTLGLVSAVSFNGNKIITAGGGGAILTNDIDLARKAKHLTTTAKLPHRWEFQHDQIGYNYRMPNLNAALAVAQLERLDEFLAAKETLHLRYVKAFAGFPGARIHTAPDGTSPNYWLNTLILEGNRSQRNLTLQRLHDEGIAARPAWQLACDSPMYRNCPSAALPISRILADTVISLPSSPALAYQCRLAA